MHGPLRLFWGHSTNFYDEVLEHREQPDAFRFSRLTVDLFRLCSGFSATKDLTEVIKWDPFWGVQTVQMYDDFEGFPL